MVPAHANKTGRRYRYYVSAAQASGSCWRLPAGDLEAIVHRSLIALLSDPVRLFGEFGGQADRAALVTRGRDMAIAYSKPLSLAELLRKLEGGIVVAETAIRISIDRHQLADMFAVALPHGSLMEPVEVDVPASLRRRGHELRLVYATPHMQPAQRDDRLIELIGKGWAAWQQLNSTIIANPTWRSHLTRLARLRFLAPDISTGILEGRQPVELTARTLLRLSDLPIAWADQRVILGFA